MKKYQLTITFYDTDHTTTLAVERHQFQAVNYQAALLYTQVNHGVPDDYEESSFFPVKQYLLRYQISEIF